MSEKKSWSLQNNKRTEAERNVFKPTGKSSKKKTTRYLISLVGVLLLVSFLMTYFSENVLEACFTKSFCFNSKDNLIIYALYVFSNILIVIVASFGAYLIGRKLASKIKI